MPIIPNKAVPEYSQTDYCLVFKDVLARYSIQNALKLISYLKFQDVFFAQASLTASHLFTATSQTTLFASLENSKKKSKVYRELEDFLADVGQSETSCWGSKLFCLWPTSHESESERLSWLARPSRPCLSRLSLQCHNYLIELLSLAIYLTQNKRQQIASSCSKRGRLARASRASHYFYSVNVCHNYRTIDVRNGDRYCKGGQITCYLIELVLLAINSTHKMKCIEKIPSYYAKNEIACRNLLIPMMRLTWSTK